MSAQNLDQARLMINAQALLLSLLANFKPAFLQLKQDGTENAAIQRELLFDLNLANSRRNSRFRDRSEKYNGQIREWKRIRAGV